MSKNTTIALEKTAQQKAARIAAILQNKRGKIVTIGEATTEAIESYLTQLEASAQ